MLAVSLLDNIAGVGVCAFILVLLTISLIGTVLQKLGRVSEEQVNQAMRPVMTAAGVFLAFVVIAAVVTGAACGPGGAGRYDIDKYGDP